MKMVGVPFYPGCKWLSKPLVVHIAGESRARGSVLAKFMFKEAINVILYFLISKRGPFPIDTHNTGAAESQVLC